MRNTTVMDTLQGHRLPAIGLEAARAIELAIRSIYNIRLAAFRLDRGTRSSQFRNAHHLLDISSDNLVVDQSVSVPSSAHVATR